MRPLPVYEGDGGRVMVRTTNLIERTFVDERRRTLRSSPISRTRKTPSGWCSPPGFASAIAGNDASSAKPEEKQLQRGKLGLDEVPDNVLQPAKRKRRSAGPVAA